MRQLLPSLFLCSFFLFSLQNAHSQCASTITSFPWNEGFENGLGTGWFGDVGTANGNWIVDDAGTTSQFTGPSTAFEGSFYLYSEVTGQGQQDTVQAFSPCFDFPSSTLPYMSFNYHMFSGDTSAPITPDDNMGWFYILGDTSLLGNWDTLWSKFGNHGDVWNDTILDLSPYAGHTLQLQFMSVSGTTGEFWQGDRAIDNIEIGLGITTNSPYCQGANDGSASVVAIFGTAPYTFLWSTGETTQSINNLSAGTYSVTVTDNLGAIGIASGVVNAGLVSSVNSIPYYQSWEDSLGSWSNSTEDDFDWTFRQNGIGGTNPTVPDFPSDGLLFIYTEASGQSAGDVAILNSPCFSFGTGTLPYMIFDYHMKVDGFGGSSANMGWLWLIADTDPTTLSSGDTIWERFGDQGNDWITDTVDLSAYTGQDFALRFVGEIGTGITQYGDRAVDNIQIFDAIDVSESCDGATGGSIAVDPQFGDSPYTYLWSTGSTAASLSNIGAGTYTITITDNSSATRVADIDVDTLVIPSPTGLTASVTEYCDNDIQISNLTIDVLQGDRLYSFVTGEQIDQGTFNTSAGDLTFTFPNTPPFATADAEFFVNIRGDIGQGGEVVSIFGNGTSLIGTTAQGQDCQGTYIPNAYSIPLDSINEWAETGDSIIFLGDAVGGMSRICGLGGGQGYSWRSTMQLKYFYSSYRPYWFANVCDSVIANAVDSGFSVNFSPNITTTYYVRYYDEFCQSWGDCDSLTITVHPKPSVLVSPDSSNICNNNGVFVTATGASTYTWSPGTGLNTNTGAVVFANPSSGQSYSVVGIDSNSCLDTTDVFVDVSTDYTTSVSTVSPTCIGATTGSATVAASGTTGPYTFIWNTGATTTTISGLPAGTYTVTITDANGCATIENAIITPNSNPLTINLSANPPACNGGTFGSTLAAFFTNGTASYTYSWSNGSNGTTSSPSLFQFNQPAGTYTITVTDGNGCSDTQSVALLEPDSLILDSVTATDLLCFGDVDGSASAFVTGGTSPYSYNWSNSGSTSTISGLGSGTYTVTITDANGCAVNAQPLGNNVTITDPPQLIASAAAVSAVSCPGGTDGSASASASGGTGSFTYLWDNGETGTSAIALDGGVHCVTVTDANGCTDTACVTIGEPSVILANTVVTDASCNGFTDGSITTAASGGNGSPYTYLWSTSATTSMINGVGAGTYTVIITDNNGCTEVFSETISEPAPVAASITSNDVSCNGENDGDATVVASGGTSPYTYLWSTGGTSTSIGSLIAGNYTVTVTDNNGCTEVESVTIAEPTLLVASIGSSLNVSCNAGSDGEATVSQTGGTATYTYVWSNSATSGTISGLSAGTYSVTVTDNNGCTDSTSIVITEPTAVSAITSVDNNVSCNGGSDGQASVVAGGGTGAYSYLWTSGSTSSTASSLMAGTYTVTVTDANGCTETAIATITEPTAISLTLSETASIACFGDATGAVSVVAAGGTSPYTYLWSNGSTTTNASALVAGTHTVTVTDNNGCTETDNITLTEPSLLVASFNTVDSISCNGVTDGALAAAASGGTSPYSYLWSTGATADSIGGLAAGTYTVTISDANGCTDLTSATLLAPAAITVSIDSSSNVNCFGGSDGEAFASGAGGTTPYSLLWSNSNTGTSVSGLAAGTYTVTLTDANGCTDETSVIITEPASSVSVSTSLVQNVSCFGLTDGSATASGSGGTSPYTYLWDNAEASATASSLSAGTHTVTVTDANGCTDTDQISITEPTDISVSLAITASISCNNASDGSMDASVSGGTTPYSYLWSTGGTSSSISGLSTGTYTVTVTDGNGCTESNSLNLTEPSLLVSVAAVEAAASCAGISDGIASVTATGGTSPYTYLWSNANTTDTASSLSSGTYSVTVTDANGCTDSSSVIITEPSGLTATATTTQNVQCNSGSDGMAMVSVSGGTTPYTYLWSNAAITDSISGLSAGTYTVTVTDANGCSITSSTTVTEPNAIILSVSTDSNALCAGSGEGGVSANASGGTTPYTYLWSNAGTSASLTGLQAGTYTVTLTDANGCTATGQSTVTEPTSVVASSSNVSNVDCNGNGTGIAAASAAGGTAPYSYLWSNGATTDTASNLMAGAYTVTITDANGCSDNSSTTITEPDTIGIATLVADVSCFGGADGSVIATATGGTSPYSYLWSNAGTADSIGGLTAGTYTLTLTDANGCTETATATVSEPTDIALTTSTTPVSCNSGSDGTATVTPTGGTAPYAYLWSDSQTDSTATGLMAGTYTVIVTDANGCTESTTATVTEPTPIATVTSSDSVSCNAGTDGAAEVTASGGTAPYTYLWSNGPTTDTISNVMAGTYTVTVTDANGCTAIDSAIVNEPIVVDVAANTVSNVDCNGNSTGIAIAFTTGGTGAYSYLWSNGATADSVNNLAAGTYIVTVTDANGCTDTSSTTITEPDTIGIATLVADVSCFGGADGSVVATATGGTSPYSYLWSNAGTADSIGGLTAGTYTLTLTDANGCTETATATVSEPTDIALSTSTTPVSCNSGSDGTATVTPTGGTAPYAYLWSDSQTDSTATGLMAGTYTVIVTDANGCTESTTATVTEPTPIATVTSSDSVSCNAGTDGAAEVTASGGTAPYTYLWSNGPTTDTISNVMAGTYTVTVTDANGCTAIDSAIVNEPIVVDVAANTVSNVDCNGNSTGIAIAFTTGGTGAYSYLWSNGATADSVNNLAAGTYIVTVTDANGCTDTSSTTITEPDTMSISDNISNVLCNAGNDGNIAIAVIGGTSPYTYLWSNAATTDSISGLTAGTYTVTVTDNNGCTKTADFTVTEPTLLSVSTSSFDAACFGENTGALFSTPSGGTTPYSATWSSGGGTFNQSGVFAGTYTVTITDGNGCTVTGTTTVSEPTDIASAMSSTAALCNGAADGTASIVASGGTPTYDYLWSNGDTTSTITGLIADTYTVTVTDANGCTHSDTVVVTEPTLLVASASTIDDVSCNGGSDGEAMASGSGGTAPYTYFWSTGSTNDTINNLLAGTYSVTVTDANGCTDSASTVVTEPDTISINASISNVSCNAGNDGTIALTVIGGTNPYTYLWSTGATTDSVSVLMAGTYTVTVTDNNGCSDSESFTVTEPTLMTASITSVTNVLCNGASTGEAVATGNGGTGPYSYLWSNAATQDTAMNLAAGSYTVTVTDFNGCTATADTVITEISAVFANLTNVTMVTCIGGDDGSLTADGSGATSPYTYLWNNSATTPTISNLTAGTYTVTVTDLNGCEDDTTFTLIEINALPVVDLGVDTIFCEQSFVLDPGNFSGYAWSTSASTSTIAVNTSGNYIVTVTDANGCENTDSILITMTPLPEVSVTLIDSADCGISNGIALATFTNPGGGNPYSYAWSNGQLSGPGITGLGLGTYTLTVADVNGCADTTSFQMFEDTIVTATLTATDVSCFGAMDAMVTASGGNGTAPYAYAWNTGATNDTLINQNGGTYAVTITDANGCQAIGDTVVNEPIAIAISSTVIEATCGQSNGSAAVDAGPTGYTFTYLWSNSQVTDSISGLSAGNYTVTVTNQFGCTETATVGVNNLGAPTLISGSMNEQCVGAEDGFAFVNATGSGPLTYAWDDPNTQTNDTASNLAPGSYGVTVTDVNGCSSFASFTLGTDFQNPVISLGNDTAVCANSIILTPGSGFNAYLWSNSSTNAGISVTSSGVYSVEVVDSNGCSANDTIDLVINAPVTFNTTANDANCNENNGSATLNVTGGGGGYVYTWSTGDTTSTVDSLAGGTYDFTITDINGCSNEGDVTVALVNAPQLTLSSVDAFCAGYSDGSASVAITGGNTPYAIQWSSGSTTTSSTNLIAGNYTVTVTDDSNCVVTGMVSVSEPPKIVLTTASLASGCGLTDGQAIVSATGGAGGYTYLWDDPQAQTNDTAINLGPAFYSVTVTDAIGCFNNAGVAVSDNGSALLLTDSEDASCENSADGIASVEALGNAPFTYEWNDNLMQLSDSAFNLLPGIYAVSVTDDLGCIAVATSEVGFINAAPIVNLGPDVVECQGAEIILTPGGGFSSYGWSTGSSANNIAVSTSGDYSVTVTNATGCSNFDSVQVTIEDLPVVNLGNDTLVCAADGFATLDLDAGAGFANYFWSTGDVTQTLTVDSTGAYAVTVSTAGGCQGFDNVIVIFDTCINVNAAAIAGDAFSMNLYPNPNQGAFNLELDGLDNGIYELSLLSLQGQDAWQREIRVDGNGTYQEAIDVRNTAAGIYILRVKGEQTLVERRVVIQ